jgi:hypothetical protein
VLNYLTKNISQNFIIPSLLPDAINLESGDADKLVIGLICPFSVEIGHFVRISHTFINVSYELDINRFF